MSWFVHDRDLRNEKDVGTLQMCPVKKRKDSNKNTLGKWKLRRTQRLLLRRIFLFGDWKSDKNDENCFIYHLWSCQKTAWLERYDYFKIYDVTTWEKTIAIHILCNISRSKMWWRNFPQTPDHIKIEHISRSIV